MADICDFVRKALEYQEDELNRELRLRGKRLVFIQVTDADNCRKEQELSCCKGEPEDEV